MKKGLSLICIFLAFYTSSFASHVLGGEVSWTCLSTGQYVFSMAIYRDCTGIPWTFENEIINIVGSPLPSGGVNSIIMEPDQTKFQNTNNGETSPSCTSDYGQEYSCSNEDQGTVQAFFYNSRPITLSGTPPSAGWRFFWESPCCRPGDLENVITAGERMLLRAIMYPGPNNLPADPCFDSSPEFRSLPTTLICRGYEFTYNHTAIDYDLDELIYSWDRPFNPPQDAPVAVPYTNGYSPTSPTPGKGANINNIPASLDAVSGITRLAVYSGTGTKKFVTVVRVDSYKAGVRTASIFREIPISIFDCPTFPNGQTNNVPQVFIDGEPAETKIVEIVAGQEISIPVQVIDNDITGVGLQQQILTLTPDGLLFTKNRTKGSVCPTRFRNEAGDPIVVDPCAYMQNQSPTVDNTTNPSSFNMKGLGVIGSEFVWQTDCKHISTTTGIPGTNEGIYNFVMRVSDDHCPIPALNYPTITVKVKDPFPLTEPIMKGISVNLDGSVTYNWSPMVDSANNHFEYQSQASRPQGGNLPTNWNTLNPSIKQYAFSQNAGINSFPVYDFIDPINLTGAKLPDLLGTFQGNDNDFYIRMRSISGCTEDVPSIWSEPVRVIELDVTPAGTGINPARSVARLSWNRPKPLNSKTYPYYLSESQTIFNIWVNDSISGPNGFTRESDWYKLGTTTATTFDVNATTCDDYVGFRIEAVDVVEFIRQQSTIQQLPDSAQRVVYSTFSVVDSLKMKTNSYIPDPQFDTLEVRADGSIFLKIDLANKQTTSDYNIYENSTSGTLLASVDASMDSVVVILPGALLNPKDLVIQAIDGCDPSNITESGVYNSFIPTGALGAMCTGEYILNWTAPGGFPNGVSGYRVFVDSTGLGYELVTTITNPTTTTASVSGIKRSTTYLFKVEAYELDGGILDAVNLSAPHEFITPSTLNNNDIVAPPAPRCTYVHDDGSVTVSWIPSLDPSDNFNEYEVKYRVAGTLPWIDATGDELLELKDDSLKINGINAQNAQYEFSISTLSGCTGFVPSATSEISSVFVTATPNVDKTGTIQWNPTGVADYGMFKYFRWYKDTIGEGYSGRVPTTAVNTNVATDNGNGRICDGGAEYYVNHWDSIFEPAVPRCEIRSNLATAFYEDSLPPSPEPLVYVSYNLANGGINVYWENDNSSGNDADSDLLTILTTDGFNSGLQNYLDVIPAAVYVHNGSINGPNSTFVDRNDLDASDTSVVVSSSTTDQCGNTMNQSGLYFHKTMEVAVEWNICDSVNEISWNPYVGFDPADTVQYEVYFDTTGTLSGWTAINAGNPTTDTTFNHLILDGGKTYRYHVRAYTNSNPTWVSNSNIESVLSIYEDTPLYSYLQYTTVLPSNNIEVQYYRDTQIPVKGYTVFRGEDKNALRPVAYFASIDLNGVDTIQYTDVLADVDNVSYYYQVQAQNACDIIVDQSNFAKSIHLSIGVDNAGLVNKLSWNRYEGWGDSVVAYNIYRGVDELPGTQLHKTILPNDLYRIQTFEDNVYGELFSTGKFCYRVEAVQGMINDKVVNGYPNTLTPKVSNSNTVCVVQEPLFYVPNAFVPGGVNKLFGPKGQFFDFSLYEMTIYNRWGEQVYLTNDINKGWDGMINGEEAGLGSYVYMIRFKDANGKEHRKKGTVTLIK